MKMGYHFGTVVFYGPVYLGVEDEPGTASPEETEASEEEQTGNGGPSSQLFEDDLLQKATATLPSSDSQSDSSFPAIQTHSPEPESGPPSTSPPSSPEPSENVDWGHYITEKITDRLWRSEIYPKLSNFNKKRFPFLDSVCDLGTGVWPMLHRIVPTPQLAPLCTLSTLGHGRPAEPPTRKPPASLDSGKFII
ncbi:UNVERIFIED_CONTAM: hypothetical protein K2H54_053795 [Gekko kuhli]